MPALITGSKVRVSPEPVQGVASTTAYIVTPFYATTTPPHRVESEQRSQLVRGDRQPGASCGVVASGAATHRTALTDEPGIRLMLESLLWSTFAANVLRPGVVRSYFTYEMTAVPDDADPDFLRLLGAQSASATIDIPTDTCVNLDFELEGLTADGVEVTEATSETASSNKVPVSAACGTALNPGTQILIDGVANPDVETAQITINNNLGAKYAIGNTGANHYVADILEIGGTMSVYYENLNLFQDAVNGTRRRLEFRLKSCADNYFVNILMPKCKLSNELGTSGNSITNGVSFTAEYDTVSGTALEISILPGV